MDIRIQQQLFCTADNSTGNSNQCWDTLFGSNTTTDYIAVSSFVFWIAMEFAMTCSQFPICELRILFCYQIFKQKSISLNAVDPTGVCEKVKKLAVLNQKVLI